MQFEGVVPIPGVEKSEEIRQIVQIVENPRPLTPEERVRMEKIHGEADIEICQGMKKLCLQALLMNYSNPMAINCLAINKIQWVRVSSLNNLR